MPGILFPSLHETISLGLPPPKAPQYQQLFLDQTAMVLQCLALLEFYVEYYFPSRSSMQIFFTSGIGPGDIFLIL